MRKLIENKFILILFLILNSCSIKNVNRDISSDSIVFGTADLRIYHRNKILPSGKMQNHQLYLSIVACQIIKKNAFDSIREFHAVAKDDKIRAEAKIDLINNGEEEGKLTIFIEEKNGEITFEDVPIRWSEHPFFEGFFKVDEDIGNVNGGKFILKDESTVSFNACEKINEETDEEIDEEIDDSKLCDGKPGTRHINVLKDGTREKGGFVADTAFVGEDVFLDKDSSVCDYATVEDNATITGETIVTENATISGKAKITGKVRVDGYARISESAKVEGEDIHITENARVRGKARIMDKAKIQGEAIIGGSVTVKSNSVVKGYFKASRAQKVEGEVDENNDYSEMTTEIEENTEKKILPRDTGPLASKGLSCRSSDSHSINYQGKTDEIIDRLNLTQSGNVIAQIKIEGKSVYFNDQNLNKKSTCGEALYSGSDKAKRECESKGGIAPYSSEIEELDCNCVKKRVTMFSAHQDEFWCTATGFLKCKGGRKINDMDQFKINILKGMANEVLGSFNFENIAELSIKTFAEKYNLQVSDMPSTNMIAYVAGIKNLYQQAKNIKSYIEEQTSLGTTNDVVMLQLDKMKDELKGQNKCLGNLREEVGKATGAMFLPVTPNFFWQ